MINPRILVQNLAHRFGYHLAKTETMKKLEDPPPPTLPDPVQERRQKLLHHHGINLVLDVGANEGYYARNIREGGYQGRIVSFEPLSMAYAKLSARAEHDPLWQTVHTALGAQNTSASINIAANSESSSLLPMLDSHLRSAPQSAYMGTEEVTVQTLDSVFDNYYQSGDRVFLKIDAQGYERQILVGASNCLSYITGIQVEASLIPLYGGETLLPEMISMISTWGYILKAIDSGFSDDESGQLLQADCTFYRSADTDEQPLRANQPNK